DERDGEADPGPRAGVGKAQRGMREGPGTVGYLEHRPEREPQGDHEPGSAEYRPGPLLDGVGRIGHRQPGERTDREGPAQQPDERMKPALDAQQDRQGDARQGSRDQANLLPTHSAASLSRAPSAVPLLYTR